MEFKVGQIWRTRGGELREIVVSPYRNTRGAFPVSAVDVGTANPYYEYLATGRCYRSIESPDDLVELVRDVDGWIEWNGGECPVPEETLVAVRFFNGKEPEEPRRAHLWAWGHSRKAGYEIAAYKVVEAAPVPVPASGVGTGPAPEIIIEPGEYVTRSGYKAVVTVTGLRGVYAVHGYIVREESDSPERWTDEGRFYSSTETPEDLVGRWNPYAGVAIDTPVWVRNDLPNCIWVPRHFAGVKDGKPLAWAKGLTSHTAKERKEEEPLVWGELSLTKPE